MTTEDDVRAILDGVRQAKLYRAIHAAWEDVQPDRPKYPYWPRTRANMHFERMAARLQEQFADDPGVKFVFANETVKIIFDQKLMARCKKADNRGLGHNVPTFTNDLFCAQSSFLAPLGQVEVVYFLDDYATEIREIVVQARDGDARLWFFPIDDTALAPTVPVVPLPTSPAPATTADVESMVQPRSKPIAEDENNKEK
jgi:hypothetical protein